TVNAGGTWQNLTSDLPLIGLNALVLAARPRDPYVLVATTSGVYACAAPSAPRWRRLGAGLPYVNVADLSYQLTHDMLVAGTYGRGVFQITLGEIGITAQALSPSTIAQVPEHIQIKEIVVQEDVPHRVAGEEAIS